VDSLRNNWSEYRHGGRGFEAPPDPSGNTSEEDSDSDPRENMTLAERSAHARAKEVLEKKREEQERKGTSKRQESP